MLPAVVSLYIHWSLPPYPLGGILIQAANENEPALSSEESMEADMKEPFLLVTRRPVE